MVHVADPDAWFRTVYTDAAKFGTKADQYVGFERMMQMFPDMTWIGVTCAAIRSTGPLEALLEKYPHLLIDTAPRNGRREVSPRRDAIPS